MLEPESTLTVEPHFGLLKVAEKHSGDNFFLESKANRERPDHRLHKRITLTTMHGQCNHAKKVKLADVTQPNTDTRTKKL